MVDVVTSENRAEFMAARMDLNVATGAPAPEAKPAPVVEVETGKGAGQMGEATPPTKPAPKAEPASNQQVPAEPDPADKELTGIPKRISEITHQRNAAQAEAAAAKARAEAAETRARELEAKLNPPKLDEIEAQIGPRPKASEYTDVEEFAEDIAEWGGKRAVLIDARARESQAAQAERAKQVSAFNARQTEFRTTHPDYDAVVGSASAIPVSQDILEELLTSDVGLAVQYHLGQNHDEIERLNKLPPAKRMLEFGRLEERIRIEQQAAPAPTAAAPVAAPAPRPKLPEPVRPVVSAGGSGTVEHLFDASGEFTGSPAQWKTLRNAGKIK